MLVGIYSDTTGPFSVGHDLVLSRLEAAERLSVNYFSTKCFGKQWRSNGVFHRDKTSASFIHRGECTGRHLVLIKMAFGCWHKSGLLCLAGPKIDECKCFLKRVNN